MSTSAACCVLENWQYTPTYNSSADFDPRMAVVPLAAQMYSVRASAARNLPATLDRLAAIGYRAVEPFDWHGVSAAVWGRELRSRGLSAVAFHLDAAGLDASGSQSPLLSGALPRSLEAVAELGAPRVVVPWSDPERLRTLEDVERLADRLNRLGSEVARWPMELGYHNHWWEFSRRCEGRTLYALLWERLEPSIFAELDVYWAAVGACDPTQVLRDLGARAKLVHLKDGPADDASSPMTALGEGALDLPAVLEAARSAEVHIVEIDSCEGDVFEALARSAVYLRHILQTDSENRRTPPTAES
jgi:sugar phosphate isomerase/epimerase